MWKPTIARRFGLEMAAAAIALACVITCGCRRASLETVPVRGTVTYMGKPVPYAVLRFQPVDAARGRSAVAMIVSDGTYEVKTLSDSPGLVPGEYLVTVSTERPPGRETAPGKSDAATKTPEVPSIIRSGFKLTVNAGEKAKVFDISVDGK